MRDRRGPVLYARTHSVGVYVLGTAAAVVALWLSLRTSIALDNLDGTATTPLSAAVVMVFGILAGGTWTGRAEQQDHLHTRVPALVRAAHPVVVLALSSVTCAATMLVLLDDVTAGAQYLRTALLWCGLALVSAVLGGATFAWVLPVIYFFLLANSGYDRFSEPRWWNVPFRPATDLAAWALSIGVAVTACVLAARRPHRR